MTATNLLDYPREGVNMMRSFDLDRAAVVAETILFCGVEYPTDVEVNLMRFNPDFRQHVKQQLSEMNGSKGVARPVQSHNDGLMDTITDQRGLSAVFLSYFV